MNSYVVIARKWRPQTFEDMIGQDHVSKTLHNALKSQRLHHALLFTGPRGVGKTSSARILAKSLKCPNAADFIPCNSCRTCEDVTAGSSMDVIEIDGASHNGVDAIRELRDTVGYMPAQGKYKIYIIDEVHMLSISAFNALLKTLEEPPPHVIFIFATTEPQKIPLTILSRVQRFDFRRIPTRLLTERLEKICKDDGVEFDKESLWLIARQADGSARDSQSLLDQIITFSGGKITSEKTVEVLGLTNRQLILATLSALVHRNSDEVLSIVQDLYMSGADARVFAHDLMESLRNLLIVKLQPDHHALIDLPDSELEALRGLSGQLSSEDIHLLFDMALKSLNDIQRSADQKLTLEMSLLRMAQAPRILEISSLMSRPENSVAPVKKKSEPQKNLNPFKSLSLEERWVKTVLQIKEKSPFLGAKLDHVALESLDGGQAVLTLTKERKFIFEQLSEPKSQSELSALISQVWGETVRISLQLTEQAQVATPLENQQQRAMETQAKIRSEVEEHPLMKAVTNHFKVQIQSIKTKELQ